MSLSSSFFTWVQGAGFYRALYAEAVAMLPPGNGERWTDIGCGPGLMVRLASRRGYQAEGIDSSPDMLQAARLLAKKERIEARFTAGSLETLGKSDAAVLSIASLLSLQADVRAGLNHLWKALKPDGRLLIVEPTDRMSPRRARDIDGASLPGPRRRVLHLWARARAGSGIDPRIIRDFARERSAGFEERLALDEMVGIWVLHKNPEENAE
jgi:ubiquinone/menaquinone biosynthesis C-methylase UbiE